MSRTVIKSGQPLPERQADLSALVSRILQDVQERGDLALHDYTLQFDRVERIQPPVSAEERASAWKEVDDQVKQDLEFAAANIRAFAEKQKTALLEIEMEILPGVTVGHRLIPVGAVGLYVPGGRYPLPSTALMGAIPAKIAGVKRVIGCTPPDPHTGTINPYSMAAMQIAGVDEVYCVGGVQAIGAMAYGTESISPVDLIVGPGNAYVTEAKRQVYGKVGIDMLAGPSEMLIVADESANPVWVAADLWAVAEHDPRAKAILISTSSALIQHVEEEMSRQLLNLATAEIAQRSWQENGSIYLVSSLIEAIELANEIAPEHLEVHTKDWSSFWRGFTNYGSLFLGAEAPRAFGDYTSGSNHILPTMGTARMQGGLWVGTFIKTATHQWMTAAGAAILAPVTERLARLEGLVGHAFSAAMRKQ
jgi:sulfopropanediol 3-dehydrogenase